LSELTQYHIQKLGTLRSRRGNWESQWEEAANYIIPAQRGSFLSRGMDAAFGGGGQKKTELQFDSAATIAAYRFTSVIESLTVPQSGVWHRLVPADKTLKRNRAARLFFDDLTELMFSYRYRPVANFVSNSQQCFLGLGVYGNGILYIDQPENKPGLRYRSIHLGEAYFVENHAGVVDTLYRSFYLSAAQCVKKFGEATPQIIKDAAASATRSEESFEILHCVYPREDYSPVRIDSKGMPFASLYMTVGQQELISEGGYSTFPYGIARYTQAPGETYGRGPAQFVLPAIKTVNQEKKTVLKQGHRVVDPVLLAYDDGNLGSFQMKAGALNPGGVSADGKRLIQELPSGNLAIAKDMMDMEHQIINDAFLITLFQILVDTPQMTATEVLERAREKGMLVAPTAGRLQAELLGPMIERELDLLARQGLLPQLPGILKGVQGIEYKIEYDSPMSRMQRAEKAAGFMRSLDMAANYTKLTGDMSPLDWFNFDVAVPEIQDIQGAPVSWTRTMEEVAGIRDKRDQQLQQEQMVNAAPALASVVKATPGLAKG
jgi:hypothetical protein